MHRPGTDQQSQELHTLTYATRHEIQELEELYPPSDDEMENGIPATPPKLINKHLAAIRNYETPKKPIIHNDIINSEESELHRYNSAQLLVSSLNIAVQNSPTVKKSRRILPPIENHTHKDHNSQHPTVREEDPTADILSKPRVKLFAATWNMHGRVRRTIRGDNH